MYWDYNNRSNSLTKEPTAGRACVSVCYKNENTSQVFSADD